MGRRGAVAAAAALAVIMCLAAPPAEAAPELAKPYDFDGNGYVDLAIGAPGLRVGKIKNAGGVIVLPSSKKGLSRREKVITQSSKGVPDGSEGGDQFGYTIASADFNGDGYADLAAGQPGEEISGLLTSGTVTVIYGSRKGLDTTRSIAIREPDGAEQQAWGYSMATIDANADGYPDLAVGAPLTRYYPSLVGGSVSILPGGSRGLSPSPLAVLTGLPEPDEGLSDFDSDNMFGAGLATGDLDGDRRSDLVIMSAGDGELYPGSVTACLSPFSRTGACQRLAHDELGVGLTSVAVGNLSGDGVPEIVVGMPELVGAFQFDDRPGPGSVAVLHLKRSGGLGMVDVTTIRQSSRGVPGSDENGDAFGTSLALADIDRDGYADLVVGAPGENSERGQVTVIRGAQSGWKTTGNYAYSQNTKGIPGRAEKGDQFGWSVTLLDHNRDGRLDLTIGAPGEDKGSGMITTLPGSGKKFSTGKSHTFGLKKLGYRYRAGAGFGATLGR